MNLAELKDRVFRMTNNIYHDIFHMRDLINTAMTSLSDGAKIQGVQAYELIPEVGSYALPDGFKSAYALIEGTADNPVDIYPLITLDEARHGYTIWNNEIVIKPTPYEPKTLYLYFYRYPTMLMNDRDMLDSEFAGYENIIASYAGAMILALPNMDPSTKYLIDQYMVMWETGRQRFAQEMAKRNKQATVRLVNQW